ncbi:MAG: hypothetical protein DI537_14430 [Stutzerimonas stutzeri]|nr:MAG: hypothetical protein DI537_14430 [Stutzerimonas stutzeri]
MSTDTQTNPFEREPTATIKNARFFDIGDSQVVYGNIYGDTQMRFPDGEPIKTSKVVDVQGDLVLTKSGSLYKVETRH